MTDKVADADAHIQRLVFVVKMATVLEECTAEIALLCASLWEKGLNAKDLHKEVLPDYGGKRLSHKAVHNWVEKFSQ
jgi:hypothetical protein